MHHGSAPSQWQCETCNMSQIHAMCEHCPRCGDPRSINNAMKRDTDKKGNDWMQSWDPWQTGGSSWQSWKQPRQASAEVCRFYRSNGWCKYGNSCCFSHVRGDHQQASQQQNQWRSGNVDFKYVENEKMCARCLHKNPKHFWFCNSCHGKFALQPSESNTVSSPFDVPSMFKEGEGTPFQQAARMATSPFTAPTQSMQSKSPGISTRFKGDEIFVHGKYIKIPQERVIALAEKLDAMDDYKVIVPTYDELPSSWYDDEDQMTSYVDSLKQASHDLDYASGVLDILNRKVGQSLAKAVQKQKMIRAQTRRQQVVEGHTASTAVAALRQLMESSPFDVSAIVQEAIGKIQSHEKEKSSPSRKSPIDSDSDSESDISITGDEKPEYETKRRRLNCKTTLPADEFGSEGEQQPAGMQTPPAPVDEEAPMQTPLSTREKAKVKDMTTSKRKAVERLVRDKKFREARDVIAKYQKESGNRGRSRS